MEPEAPHPLAGTALPSPLGLFATLDEYSLRHLIISFLDGVDLVRLAACRRVLAMGHRAQSPHVTLSPRLCCAFPQRVASAYARVLSPQLGYAHNVL